MSEQTLPPQHQKHRPGEEGEMHPEPIYISEQYKAAGKLEGKVAIVTGADSGIGRAVAVYFAREGADIVMLYLEEHADAEHTRKEVERAGSKVKVYAGDVAEEALCRKVVEETVAEWGQIHVLVNNAGEQHPRKNLEDIPQEQWEQTFRTNIFGMFQLTKTALPHMQSGASIINTTSVTAYKGSPMLLDYSSTKGAITAFTRSLSMNVAERGIRVNGVAPGPIWTPLIPSTFDAENVETFGANTPMKRPGQPAELGPAYVYLACDDSSYMSGQVLHINGGSVVNG
ncbi:MAG: SDR family oxidoreductase [Pseudomonas profundi]|uniref:SDR family oxidoreductase n=1 Tax=Pseudomonas profundi TaxID=1981513 RepID=UPI003003648C